ncbi:MAG: hypothetical protein AAB263_20175 [Planctomycetota bacterium]
MIRLYSPAALWVYAFVAVLAWGWFRLDQASGKVRAAQEQLTTVNHELQRLGELRSHVQSPVRGRRPQDDLVTLAQKALIAAGLPITSFSGVQPRADQTTNGLHIQTVQLRLQGLRPADFGAWLAAWSTPEQSWRLSELQMVHATTPPATGNTGGMALDNNRFDLTLVLTAPYLEDRP